MCLAGFILGHSFVTGTLHHLSPASSPSSRRLASLFKVNKTIDKLKIIGKRGARITDPSFSLPQRDLLRYKPSFVILDYGSNDVVSGADPLNIATTIVDLANTLVEKYSVQQVFICSILTRTGTLGCLTPPQFKEAAVRVNKYLRTMCSGDPNLTFHNHKGFWDVPVHTWSHDGVHPNSKFGRQKYIASLRKAIFLATGKLLVSRD